MCVRVGVCIRVKCVLQFLLNEVMQYTFGDDDDDGDDEDDDDADDENNNKNVNINSKQTKHTHTHTHTRKAASAFHHRCLSVAITDSALMFTVTGR